MGEMTLREAFDRTDYELVRTGAGNRYEIPVSTPAILEVDGEVTGSAVSVCDRISASPFASIVPDTEGEPDGGIYVSTKLYDGETNEMFHVKMDRQTVRVFPKDDELSFETFRHFVEHVEGQLGVALEPRGEDGE